MAKAATGVSPKKTRQSLIPYAGRSSDKEQAADSPPSPEKARELLFGSQKSLSLRQFIDQQKMKDGWTPPREKLPIDSVILELEARRVGRYVHMKDRAQFHPSFCPYYALRTSILSAIKNAHWACESVAFYKEHASLLNEWRKDARKLIPSIEAVAIRSRQLFAYAGGHPVNDAGNPVPPGGHQKIGE